MANATTYAVTRLPGAPARRAGREWPPGETVTVALSPEEAAALDADPGYTLDRVALEPAVAPPRTKGTRP